MGVTTTIPPAEHFRTRIPTLNSVRDSDSVTFVAGRRADSEPDIDSTLNIKTFFSHCRHHLSTVTNPVEDPGWFWSLVWVLFRRHVPVPASHNVFSQVGIDLRLFKSGDRSVSYSQKHPLAYLEQVRQHICRIPVIDLNTHTPHLRYPNVGISTKLPVQKLMYNITLSPQKKTLH